MNQNAQYELHHIPLATCNQVILKSTKKKTQPSFMRQISKQNVIQEKHKVNDLQAFAKKSLRGLSSINC